MTIVQILKRWGAMKMKTCTIYGDMSAENSGDAYPTETFCDDCYDDMEPASEDSGIVAVQDYDPSLGTKCSTCGKTAEQEREEQED